MEIYELIKEKRQSLGYSADKMADLLGINRATYYRYESNEIKKMPYTIVGKLSEVLHVSPAYLMGWEDETGNDITASNIVMELYRQLDPDDQAEIIDVMKLKLSRKKDTSSTERISV